MRIAIISVLLSCSSTSALSQEAPVEQPLDRATPTEVTLIAGTDFITGDFGGQKYETITVSTGVRVKSGRLSISASIPYVFTSAPEDLIVSQGGLLGTPLLAPPASQSAQAQREGVGDLSVQAAYQLPINGLNAVVSGSVKTPTASSQSGLGSGEFDYGISGQLSKRLGPIIPFITAGYTIVGEPQGYEVRNTISGSAGSQILIGENSSASIFYAYEQSATESIHDHHSAGIGLSTGLSSNLRLGVDASAGLSDDAPDARVGLKMGLGF